MLVGYLDASTSSISVIHKALSVKEDELDSS